MAEFKMVSRKNEAHTSSLEVEKLEKPKPDLSLEFLESKLEPYGVDMMSDRASLRLHDRACLYLNQIWTEYGKLPATDWLKLFNQAHAAAVATFENPVHEPLRDYRALYVEDQEARVVAAHTLTLWLWSEVRRQGVPNGKCLEAACQVCGLDPDYLPKRVVRDNTDRAASRYT